MGEGLDEGHEVSDSLQLDEKLRQRVSLPVEEIHIVVRVACAVNELLDRDEGLSVYRLLQYFFLQSVNIAGLDEDGKPFGGP